MYLMDAVQHYHYFWMTVIIFAKKEGVVLECLDEVLGAVHPDEGYLAFSPL